MADPRTITLLLDDLADGDKALLDRLIPLVYEELRRIADGQLRRERPGHTLQPTAPVHEIHAGRGPRQRPGAARRHDRSGRRPERAGAAGKARCAGTPFGAGVVVAGVGPPALAQGACPTYQHWGY
jgi:hypothetical protein